LKKHLPIIEDKVIFTFLTKILRQFVQEDRREIELLGFFINYVVEQPLAITWTIQKIDEIATGFFEKLSKFSGYCS